MTEEEYTPIAQVKINKVEVNSNYIRDIYLFCPDEPEYVGKSPKKWLRHSGTLIAGQDPKLPVLELQLYDEEDTRLFEKDQTNRLHFHVPGTQIDLVRVIAFGENRGEYFETEYVEN